MNVLCEMLDLGGMMNLQIPNVQQSIRVLFRIIDLVWALIEDDIIFMRFVSIATAGFSKKVFQSPLLSENINNKNI